MIQTNKQEGNMKVLNFECRGKLFKVNEKGELIHTDMPMKFHDSWQFLGVSYHHWRRGIDTDLKEAFNNPYSLIGGIVWDRDHGTVRQWGGSYNGRLPRVTNAFLD